ncbi:YheT family hydrolase [Simkania negevensis]|nr:alpha/beta fold hydrolase [Simkania negevensis]MCB1067047.1 alpha/beta fold hydrolase [Simkania sp.]MCB1074211.1 alpha/beta fold hydrolase [Simkania sp.]
MSGSGQPIFKPFPFFAGCHTQTIAASFLTFARNPESTTRFVHLSDGDRITYEVSTPTSWKVTDPTVVMVHGLCGSHRSPYIVRLANKLDKRNIRTIRINLRGCGTGRGHAKKMYHVDCSNDIWHALKKIKHETPDSPLTLMGFSLGGNIVLKMAGEWGEEAQQIINKVIAINPPIDMYASVRLLSKNKVYERYFMRYLRSDVLFRHNYFEDMPPIEIPTGMSLLDFDEFYIAPESGYESAQDYYYATSSGRLIPDIQVSSHILFAKDDPIVDCNVMEDVPVPHNVDIVVTDQGGHLGYLGMPGQEGGFHWMDSIILQWIFEEG